MENWSKGYATINTKGDFNWTRGFSAIGHLKTEHWSGSYAAIGKPSSPVKPDKPKHKRKYAIISPVVKQEKRKYSTISPTVKPDKKRKYSTISQNKMTVVSKTPIPPGKHRFKKL